MPAGSLLYPHSEFVCLQSICRADLYEWYRLQSLFYSRNHLFLTQFHLGGVYLWSQTGSGQCELDPYDCDYHSSSIYWWYRIPFLSFRSVRATFGTMLPRTWIPPSMMLWRPWPYRLPFSAPLPSCLLFWTDSLTVPKPSWRINAISS